MEDSQVKQLTKKSFIEAVKLLKNTPNPQILGWVKTKGIRILKAVKASD